jgi:hypothetical protein
MDSILGAQGYCVPEAFSIESAIKFVLNSPDILASMKQLEQEHQSKNFQEGIKQSFA